MDYTDMANSSGLGYGLNPLYLGVSIITFIISAISQWNVTSTFNKYSQVPNKKGISGFEVASAILQAENISNINIQRGVGKLTDYYDPRNDLVMLSPEVYEGDSVASLGVAAHEIGHVAQQKKGYLPIKLKSMMVPIAGFGQNIGYVLIILGLTIQAFGLVNIGLVLFSLAVILAFVTLPVEFNASSRAVENLRSNGLIAPEEEGAVRKVLGAAALTYVASAAIAVLNLLYLLMQTRRKN